MDAISRRGLSTERKDFAQCEIISHVWVPPNYLVCILCSGHGRIEEKSSLGEKHVESCVSKELSIAFNRMNVKIGLSIEGMDEIKK